MLIGLSSGLNSSSTCCFMVFRPLRLGGVYQDNQHGNGGLQSGYVSQIVYF